MRSGKAFQRHDLHSQFVDPRMLIRAVAGSHRSGAARQWVPVVKERYETTITERRPSNGVAMRRCRRRVLTEHRATYLTLCRALLFSLSLFSPNLTLGVTSAVTVSPDILFCY